MSHPLEGRTRLVKLTTTSTGAGNTDVVLRPDEGCVWELYWAIGKQADGAVAVSWLWTDDVVTDETLASDTSGGSGYAFMPGLPTDDNVGLPQTYLLGPIVLTYRAYLTYRFVASAISKVGTVLAIVKEFKGVQSAY